MLPYSTQSIDQDDIQAVTEALNGQTLTQGESVMAFEKALAEYLGVKYVAVMNSGTSALWCAYKTLGLRKGEEIITTPVTFAATSNMAVLQGAKPRFCDVKPDGNMDETQIEQFINPKTRAIVPVDFGGNPVEMDLIRSLSLSYGIPIIQDCSHALGSELNGIKVGSRADMAIFSFHAIKPITTGEGGAVATNDEALYEKLCLYRTHGIYKTELWDSEMKDIGFNFRLSDINCALGLSQLKKLDSFIEKREEIAVYYDAQFRDHAFFDTIPIPSYKKSSRHLYPILLKEPYRDHKQKLFEKLRENDLGVQVHYKPTYQFAFYQQRFGKHALKSADAFYEAELSIPCHQKMSMNDAEKTVSILNKNLHEALTV